MNWIARTSPMTSPSRHAIGFEEVTTVADRRSEFAVGIRDADPPFRARDRLTYSERQKVSRPP